MCRGLADNTAPGGKVVTYSCAAWDGAARAQEFEELCGVCDLKYVQSPTPASTPSSTQYNFKGLVMRSCNWPVLRVFPPCALISHAQGSSGVVDNMPFAWRGHTKSLATRARPSPDLAVWLE